jgi:methionine sulfoxide reductase heme-binding subunit
MATGVVDSFMKQKFIGTPISRRSVALWFLRIPAVVPVLFMSRAVITLNNDTLNISVADVLGTGAEALMFLTLLVTPMITVTGQRWFAPLRKSYGIMCAVTAIIDAIIASITTSFAGGVFGRLAGHSFLLAGFTMVLLLIPPLATANNRAQRWLGRYWKPLQRVTYIIWGLLFVHLALLEGFGFPHGSHWPGDPAADGDPILHQRLYQFMACSVPLLVLRLPPVTHWIAARKKAGQGWVVYLAILPLAILFIIGFSFILNEEIFKGVGAFTLHPKD